MRWTDPSGRCVPEWVPGGEPGCTLRAGIGSGRLDWQGVGDYAWDVVEGVGLPGAMAVDAIAGTNGTQQILDDAGTGTYLGVAVTGVATLGGLQAGGAISTAALRGQVWLTSGSRLAVGVGLVGLGLNAADDGVLWLRTMQGDCAAFGEWAALQQLGAADGLLPFGDVLAAGMLLPGMVNRNMALGLGDDLISFAQRTNSIPWPNWTGTLTRRNVYGRSFGRAFTDASRNASRIHFNLTGMDDLRESYVRGKAGFIYTRIEFDYWRIENATNTEFTTVLRNDALLWKTTFYRNGQIVPVEQVQKEVFGP